MTPSTIAAITMTGLFLLLLIAVVAVACHHAPKGGWDHTDHHARRDHR